MKGHRPANIRQRRIGDSGLRSTRHRENPKYSQNRSLHLFLPRLRVSENNLLSGPTDRQANLPYLDSDALRIVPCINGVSDIVARYQTLAVPPTVPMLPLIRRGQSASQAFPGEVRGSFLGKLGRPTGGDLVPGAPVADRSVIDPVGWRLNARQPPGDLRGHRRWRLGREVQVAENLLDHAGVGDRRDQTEPPATRRRANARSAVRRSGQTLHRGKQGGVRSPRVDG